jgi:uncharacterized protein GlcG (DUF336 family)
MLSSKPVLTEAAVAEIVAASWRQAIELGDAVTVVVVGDAAAPRALLRMDGADLLTVGFALGKARLAATNAMPTRRWRGLASTDPYLAATVPIALDRLLGGAVLFAGGYPVQVGGVTIGGIGVSGGSEAADDDIARAGLASIGEAEQFTTADAP